MLRTLLIVAVAVVAALPTAAARAALPAGAWELTLAGEGTVVKNNINNNAETATVYLGYYITKQVEVSVRQAVTYTHSNDTGQAQFAGTELAGDWHFDTGTRWVPFIGVNTGVGYGNIQRGLSKYGPEGGVKYFLNPTTFIQLLVQYEDPYYQPSQGELVISLSVGVGLGGK